MVFQGFFPGCTYKMGLKNIGIDRVYQGIIKILTKKEIRMAHEVLVQRVILGDKETQ